jgi:hypothetical protein
MDHLRSPFIAVSALICAAACSCNSDDDSTHVQALSPTRVLDLNDVKQNPATYQWLDFRPNVQKLILSGAAETEHVALLWYTVPDGSVGLHLHAKTESVYVIEGTQTDAKGVYPTGTVYFNPPGSGHALMNSSGLFILAYASPPDFANTSAIEEYTPVRIDTAAPDLTSAYAFEQQEPGVRSFGVPLVSAGGMSAQLIELTAPGGEHGYLGNYLLVLRGQCDIDGVVLDAQKLVVAQTVEPRPFAIRAAADSTCLSMGISF